MRTKALADFRHGLIGAWCPSISGATGFRVPNLVPAFSAMTLVNMDPATDWVTYGQNTSSDFTFSQPKRIALDFDGVDDRLESLETAVPYPEFSVSLWVNLDYTNSDDNAVIFEHGLNESIKIGLAKNDLLVPGFPEYGTYASRIIVFVKGVKVVTPLINTSGTYFYFLAATFRYDLSGNYYVALTYNTIKNGPYATSATQIDAVKKIFVGGGDPSVTSTTSMAGRIDDVRVYNRVLSDPEIKAMYYGGRGYGLIPTRKRNYYKRKSAFLATNPLVVNQAIKTSYTW